MSSVLATTQKEFKPSAFQQAFFDECETGKGNIILVAVAGAGKTTTIVKVLPKLKGWIFLGAYNTKMAKELKDRIVGMSNVRAGTFHSAGFSALKFSFKNHRLEVDDKKVQKILDEYIVMQCRDELREIARVIVAAVSMAKQRGIGALSPMDNDQDWIDMIEHFGIDEDMPEGVSDLSEVVAVAKTILKQSNGNLDTIDFNDMVYLPLVKNVRMLQSDWVFIDEAQDTNPTRRALAKKMLKTGGRLVAVGDPHQAIFGFTGADNDSLEQIKRDFNCKEMPLTITYRCPKAVVRHAQQWVKHIQSADTAPEGELSQLDYKKLTETVQKGDAILCRYNKYLVNLCFKLIREGKPAKIEGREIGSGLIALANKWKIKSLDTLVDRVAVYQEREVAKALKKQNESKAESITDKCETLLVLIERAKEQKMSTVYELVKMIEGIFTDTTENNSTKNLILLCSIHRAKGLEWDRVFILGRAELQPSKFAKQEWQIAQEINLIYVAVTRAMKTLVEVHGVKEEKKQQTLV